VDEAAITFVVRPDRFRFGVWGLPDLWRGSPSQGMKRGEWKGLTLALAIESEIMDEYS